MTKFVLIEDLSDYDEMPNCWTFDGRFAVEEAKEFALTRFAFNAQEDGFEPDNCKITWTEEPSTPRKIRGEENYPGPCAAKVVWYVIESEN